MSWARFDDRWHDHPKTIAAGLDGAGLFVMCVTWAHQTRRTSKHPGVVPDALLARFAGPRAKSLTKRLHDVGFFDDRTEHGWPIHDFNDYLPRYDPEQAQAAGSLGGQARAAKQTASKPLGEPPDIPLSEPPDEELADRLAVGVANGKQTSSTRASARRNPVPVPKDLPATPGADAPADIGAQRIVGAWVDAYSANDVNPTASVKGQAAKSIGELLKAGNDPQRVLAAAKQAGTKGYPDIGREIGPMNGRAVVTTAKNPNHAEGW